ncbi:hypothetical protein [Rhizobium lusitanum]|jgi:hypothetical protein|uniref:Uncharacterized protein n=1 Tax=Rhizobium lusitanum TaxID=293958 RepID=A0A1C3VSR9_9HYPH|nr:hypothetical protein [Rhizobium lusitanum]SCB30554.1 hypothetical protein GA0061101_106124 [Rhizobium lusitanum]
MSVNELKVALKYAKTDLDRDAALAKFQLDEDMQFFDGNTKHKFVLDQMQKDVLIAHTRQDAAHALITSLRLVNEIRIIKWILLTVLAIQVFIVFR